ncbi:MAG: hypothetical protein FWE03_06560 [Firmicutes bacterium]|nr:hypothetical protein [Bacillota bacterium]
MDNNKSVTQIRLEKDTHIKIKYIAEIKLRSLNAQMEYAIEKYIREFEKEHGEILIPKPQ